MPDHAPGSEVRRRAAEDALRPMTLEVGLCYALEVGREGHLQAFEQRTSGFGFVA